MGSPFIGVLSLFVWSLTLVIVVKYLTFVMRAERVGCLPVVIEGRLVGLVTERDLMDVSAKLLEDYLRDT